MAETSAHRAARLRETLPDVGAWDLASALNDVLVLVEGAAENALSPMAVLDQIEPWMGPA